MNKYFLSLITVLIIFQSLFLIDDIFFKKTEKKIAYPVILNEESNDVLDIKVLNQSIEKKDNDLDGLLKNASFEKGIKISKQCSACHDFSAKKNIKIGPPLWGIINREAGVVEGFKYSKAFLEYGKKWTNENLYNFLEDPKSYIKGTKMIYRGLEKSKDRINLISYLNTLK